MTSSEQTNMQTATPSPRGIEERYQLFKFDTCPFCLRVRMFIEKHNINVQYRDIHRDADARNELMVGGGRSTVPCLRIERDGDVTWMYESADIMRYLHERHVTA